MTLNASGTLTISGPTAATSIAIEIYNTSGITLGLADASVRALAGVPSGAVAVSNLYGKTYNTQRGIFGYGTAPGSVLTSITNLVSNTGVVATDTAGVGTVRTDLAACGYGMDKGIFGYGALPGGRGTSYYSITNRVSNTGVVATDTAGVGSARGGLAACGYGRDKGIFGYGNQQTTYLSMTNLVSNTGVVATDTAGVGTVRSFLAAASYGLDRGIFGYGGNPTIPPTVNLDYSLTNLVSNTGVVATDTAGVGTARRDLAACGYGADRAVFGYGFTSSPTSTFYSITNLVSNTGVVATNTTGVGTARRELAACRYGNDRGIFGYGLIPGFFASMTNLVSNTGVVATDTAGVGTARSGLAACGYANS